MCELCYLLAGHDERRDAIRCCWTYLVLMDSKTCNNINDNNMLAGDTDSLNRCAGRRTSAEGAVDAQLAGAARRRGVARAAGRQLPCKAAAGPAQGSCPAGGRHSRHCRPPASNPAWCADQVYHQRHIWTMRRSIIRQFQIYS